MTGCGAPGQSASGDSDLADEWGAALAEQGASARLIRGGRMDRHDRGGSTTANVARPPASTGSSTRTKSTTSSASPERSGRRPAHSGIRAIVDFAMVSYERLPMLEIVFDRLVRLLTTSLRNFFSDNVEVSLTDITSVRFGDYSTRSRCRRILAVFKAEEWDNFGLITVDSTLAYSVIDVLLGGRRAATRRGSTAGPSRPSRPASSGACSISCWRTREHAFQPLSPVRFTSTASRPTRASPPSRGPPTPPS